MIIKNKSFLLFSGLIFLTALIIASIATKLVPLLGHAVYYCQSYISSRMTFISDYIVLIPIFVLSLILIISLANFFALILKTQLLKNKMKVKGVRGYRSKTVTKIGLQGNVILVKSDKIFAFCLGIRNPKIYLSSNLLHKFSQKELEAILLHEKYHLENHDTLIMIVAFLSESLLPFFPLIGDFVMKYRVEREMKADIFAIDNLGESRPLVSALRKFLAYPYVKTTPAVSIAEKDTLEPRINFLVNKKYKQKHLRAWSLLVTFLSTIVLGLILVFPIHASEMHDAEKDFMMLCVDPECARSCKSKEIFNSPRLYSPASQSSLPLDK